MTRRKGFSSLLSKKGYVFIADLNALQLTKVSFGLIVSLPSYVNVGKQCG